MPWVSGGGGVGALAPNINLSGTYAARPAAGTLGRMYYCTDGSPVVFYDDGTAWRPIVNGTLGTESAPANSLAGYAVLNLQAGTVADAAGGCARIQGLGSGAGVHHLQGIDKPFAFGQTLLVCLKPWNNYNSQNLWSWGVYLHDTVGGTLESFCAATDTDQNGGLPFGAIGNKFDRITWTDANTPLANPFEDISYLGSGELLWFRLRSHGPNQAGASIEGSYSTDGKNFVVRYDVGLATPFNRAGFYVDPVIVTPGGAPNNVTCESFLIA
jgi:hypothetical protein